MVKLVVKRDLKKFFPSEFSNRKLIGQFLDYVMNHFFQESMEEEVNGYIGKKTVAMEDGDYYIEEPTNERQNYQLTPALVSLDENNNTKIVDYCGFINALKLQGVDTNDIGRIIDGKYWSWSPLINADMFINYNYYYWVESGPAPYEITYETDVKESVIGKSHFSIIVDDNEIDVLTGMRIIFRNDVNSEYNNKTYIVENVGREIMLLDDTISYSTNTIPDYYVMERGCKDGNKWSSRNRWFHRSVISKGDTNINFIQAKKPILCFNRDMELYNHGIYSRGYVDFVYDGGKNDIHGKLFSSVVMQGVRELKDGDKILVIGDTNSENNNRIYEVSGKDTIGTIILQMLYNGLSDIGSPVEGEDVNCLYGKYEGICFHYNGINWVQGQQKLDVNQSPLFKLYDKDGIALDNKLYYDQSSFKGSKLFDYKIIDDTNAIVDEDLGKKIITDGYGNYIFENLLSSEKYTYVNYMDTEEIKGYKFVKINGSDEYLNDWRLSTSETNNYLTTEIKLDAIVYDEETDGSGVIQKFIPIELAYTPAKSEIRNSSYVYINGKMIVDGVDYIIDNNVLKIFSSVDLEIDDYIYVKILVDRINDTIASGYYYDLPISLSANPLNESVTEIKYNECFNQMTSIIGNQKGFSGNSGGDNNYINTKQDTTVGTEIIQHATPILRTMLLNSNDDTNIRNVISFVAGEYEKFRVKFKNVIEVMSKTNEFSDTFDITQIEKDVYLRNVIRLAISKLTVGKEGLDSFYNNGICEQLEMECYVPSSPAYLGLDSVFKPRLTTVEDKDGTVGVLLCHDGTYQELFGDYRDEALLRFEEYVYESIPQKFRDNVSIEKYNLIPGKFRKTDYSLDEYKLLMNSFFEKWCSENGLNYGENTAFDVKNPLTWNYTGCVDIDGSSVGGSYKALYLYFYDTYRPHTHPWEMLGFVDKPEWWEEKYGKAPYTSLNIPMWKDIENGFISEGESKGYHKQLERKGLIEKFLPVDNQGNLLPPTKCGVVEKAPTSYYASREWVGGDIGSIELMWRYSTDFRYALQTVLYLMKPIKWVEENWETLNKETLFKGTNFEQLIYTDTLDRTTSENTHIHNEVVDGEYIRHYGIQQWIADYLVKQNLGITEILGNPYRGIDVKLFYKCGAYYKKDTVKVLSDNYGLIPSENHHLNVIKSYTSNKFAYSAMIIMKTENGYVLDGYNLSEPYFNVLIPEKSGRKTSVEVNGRNVTYYNVWKNQVEKIKYKTTFTSVQELYNVICGYGKYLEHIEKWEFLTINSNGVLINFNLKAEDFLRWTSVNPDNNQIIILNPAASEVRIHHKALLDIVGKRLNGLWTVVGTNGNPIYNEKLNVYRHDGYTDISTGGDFMTMLRLNTVEYEHCILFDSKTIYGDILYDALRCIKAQRFKLCGIRASMWNGTFLAPGYLIQDGGCVSNFDKLANDFNYAYDTDDIRSYGNFRKLAQQTIGYQESPTFENLLLNDRNMFDFYKGLLKEKGTRRSFGKLNRSTYIMASNDSKIDLYDNWAFKLSDFGYTANSSSIELNVSAENITQNPQIVSFSTDENHKNDNMTVINVNWGDKNWLKRRDNKGTNRFKTVHTAINPIGGFLRKEDVDYVVPDISTFEENRQYMKEGETIWVVRTTAYDWNVYKRIENDQYISLKVDNIKKLKNFNTQYLTEGDLVFVVKDILANYEDELNDVNGITKNSAVIYEKAGWSVFQWGTYTIDDKDGQTHTKQGFILYRAQTEFPNASELNNCFIINDETNETLSKIQIYDPIINVIPNNVLDEVNYITAYDPVNDYNDVYKWGDSKVGFLWWDVSKVRYLDYHQGDINYKRDNWGKQLPGSEIAIMEWTKSTTKPSDGVNYVHKQIWNSQTMKMDSYYYHWVKNVANIPAVPFRTMSALTISNVINDPTKQGIIWMAPIDVEYTSEYTSAFILANFDTVTTGSDFVVQLNFKDNVDLNSHTEWVLVREGDDDEVPEAMWTKMRDSLIGQDASGLPVPDVSLPERNRYGIQIRPRQTMFKDMIEARRNFVDIINNIFKTRDPSSAIDVGTAIFNTTFDDVDAIPENDYVFGTYRELMNSQDNQLIGKTVLVEKDEEHGDIWTLWKYIGSGEYELINYQKYDMTKFWNYDDLYRDDLDVYIQPDYEIFINEKEMVEYINSNDVLKGTHYKYLSGDKWILVEYHGKNSQIPFETIGIEDGTIELNDLVYSFLSDVELKENMDEFIDGLTKFEYLDNEAKIVLQRIISYFEKV